MFDTANNPMDPVNALLGFVVSALGQAILSGATQAILGRRVDRALRGAFGSAFEATAVELTTSSAQADALRDALRKPRRELVRPENFETMPELIDVWVGAFYESTPADWRSAQGAEGRPRLARTLVAQISQAVLADALAGGPLQPLAEHVYFQRTFGLGEEILQQVRPVREMLEELVSLARQEAARGDGPDAATTAARTLIDDRAATFTGRKYLCRAIDDLIGSPGFPSGYVLILGEPGIGKTSLLAHLVSERGYLYHFNNRRQGITSAQAFLDSVCRQIVSRYHLSMPFSPDTPASGAALSSLLAEAAHKVSPAAPLIIAVDALDESEPARDGANRLLLPAVLPPNVYFLVTSRPLARFQLSLDQSRTVTIDEENPENLRDIGSYIGRELDGPFASEFAERIAAWQATREEFVGTLIRKSQGNFMYTVHMLASIRRSRLSEAAVSDIAQLPTGLTGYYEMHWQVMKQRWQPALWDKHASAVRCLALMRNPVSPTMLIELAGQENLAGVDESLVLRVFNDWREFLDRGWNGEYREYRYSIYHDTFREFLETEGPSLEPIAQSISRNEIALLRQILDGASPPGPV